MGFVISGLPSEPYRHLYGLPDDELAALGVKRYLADCVPGFPDRIEMRDAQVGEPLLLLNHQSVAEETPYKASHAIFVLEGATHAYRGENIVPEVMFSRTMSLRAFSADGMMQDAALASGPDIASTINLFFENAEIETIHAHNAVRGCYSGRIDRL
jgi:hypothetical protein